MSTPAAQAELVAIDNVRRAGGITRAGTEYFDDIAFTDAVDATADGIIETEANS